MPPGERTPAFQRQNFEGKKNIYIYISPADNVNVHHGIQRRSEQCTPSMKKTDQQELGVKRLTCLS